MSLPFYDLSAQHGPLQTEFEQTFARVLSRSHFILGPEVESFEREFADYCGAAHCIGCSNGLDALQLILRAADIGPGDEVVVPAHTFVATWMAVSTVGAQPVGADCEEDSCNVAPAAVAAAITPRTRAIIAVHLYGRPADMVNLRSLADRHGLLLIEDAAQAHGATLDGRRTGTLGDAAAFSFYPTKNLGALGDGGAVVTNDPALAERARRIGNYGSTAKYHHDSLGLNARLDELQAALLRVKLPHLDGWNAERRRLAAAYANALAGVPGLDLPMPGVPGRIDPAWHLFVVQAAERDLLQQQLAAHGMQALIHYPTPPHLQGAYAGRPGEFPVAERLCDRVLSLPFYPGIGDLAVHAIAGRVRGVFAGC